MQVSRYLETYSGTDFLASLLDVMWEKSSPITDTDVPKILERRLPWTAESQNLQNLLSTSVTWKTLMVLHIVLVTRYFNRTWSGEAQYRAWKVMI